MCLQIMFPTISYLRSLNCSWLDLFVCVSCDELNLFSFKLLILMYLPYDPAIPLWSIYQRDIKTNVQTKSCMQMFTTLFTITKNWGKTLMSFYWRKETRLRYSHTVAHNLAIKKNQVLDTHRDMDESQIFVWHSGKDIDIGTDSTSSCQGMSLTSKGHQ